MGQENFDTRKPRAKHNIVRLSSAIVLAISTAILMPSFFGYDTANAAVCAQCHSDGRSGTPPATPTHISMGLVKAPASTGSSAATKASSAPAATVAPRATAPRIAAPTITPKTTLKPGARNAGASASAGNTAMGQTTPAASKTSVCAQCHSDGRSGPTPPGHRAISGIKGSGAAPQKVRASGGKAGTAAGIASGGARGGEMHERRGGGRDHEGHEGDE